MHIYQEILTSLENEVKDLLRQAGYLPESLVLKMNRSPTGWSFEVLAAKDSSTRHSLCFPHNPTSAGDMLDILRSKLSFVQTELQLA